MPDVWINLAHVYFAQGNFALAVKMVSSSHFIIFMPARACLQCYYKYSFEVPLYSIFC